MDVTMLPGPRASRTAGLPPDRHDSAFGTYTRAIRRRPWLVALITLLCVGAAVAWLHVRSSEYQAKAQILVTPVSADAAPGGLQVLTESVDPTRTLQTAATVLSGPRSADLAAQRLGAGWTPRRVLDDVKVDAQGDSNVVAISATDASARTAANVANAYTRGALQARAEALRSQVDVQLAGLEARKKAIGTTDPATTAALAGKISELQSIRNGQDPNFSLLQTADVPGSPTGTKPWMIIVLAVLAGLVIGTGAAVLLELLDRHIRDEDELADILPAPILARVPLERRRGRGDEPSPAAREAWRTLQIQLESRGSGSRVVAITSATEGDGKTTTAIGLAETLAASGREVILLDLDLRKSEAGSRLGAASDVLRLFRANARLSDALVRVPHQRLLRVLSAQAPAEAQALVDALSRRLPELLAQARELADHVVIDTAPLGRVSDALRIAATADDVVVVARTGHTTRQELTLTRDLLEQLGIRPAGIVMVGAGAAAKGGYGYGYGLPQQQARIEQVSKRKPPAQPGAGGRTTGTRRPRSNAGARP